MRHAISAATVAFLAAAGTLHGQTLGFKPPPGSPISAIIQTVGSTQGVAVGDFNHDGKLDVALSTNGSPSHNQVVVVFLGNGDGTFLPITPPDFAGEYSTGKVSQMVVVADFQGNGKLDLAVPNASGNDISIFLGKGDGAFQPRPSVAAGPANFLAVADFNKDGKADLAVSFFSSNLFAPQLAILLSKGDGTFQPPLTLNLADAASWVGAADFNGDGIPDLAAALPAGLVILLANKNPSTGNWDGSFGAPMSFPLGRGSAPSGVIADFNEDGKPDVAISNAKPGLVSVLLGNGNGTFQPSKDYPAGTAPHGLAVADLDGDGHLDIAVDDQQAGQMNLAVLRGAGDGNFQEAVFFAGGVQPEYIAAGDFNNDGQPDLALANAVFGDPRRAVGTILINTGPKISGIVNAASFVPGGLVPGGIATLFGANLTSSTGINLAAALPLTTELLKSGVKINDRAAPIFAVDNVNGQQQINFQVPWELADQASASVQVLNNGASSAPMQVPVLPAQPGVFAYSVGGQVFGAILHANFQLADTAHPAEGGEIVLIYCTNLGAVSPNGNDGEAGTGAEKTIARPVVTIGGASAAVSFSGLAPGFVGLNQINAQVPTGLGAGNRQLVITIAGASSNSVLLPVK